MKSISYQKIATPIALVAGVALWGGYAKRFESQDKLDYEPNVASIKGSPYGKVLALAMQGTVSFYWHKGTSHEHSQSLAENGHVHTDACGAGCDHSDGTDCDHSDGSSCDHVKHDFVSGPVSEHPEGCGCPAHSGDTELVKSEAPQKPLRKRAKNALKLMAATAHKRTDDKPLSQAHQKYLQGVTEDKLRLAYELDPTNYTNYGNYHLFLATNSMGHEDANDSAAVELAKKTLEFCKIDEVDPASWITAASAAYNIIYHIGRYYDQFTVPEAKASLAEFDYCMTRYEKLLNAAIQEGRIVSEKRYKEMQERARYLTKLREAQGVYMKRVMTSKMASIEPINDTNK